MTLSSSLSSGQVRPIEESRLWPPSFQYDTEGCKIMHLKSTPSTLFAAFALTVVSGCTDMTSTVVSSPTISTTASALPIAIATPALYGAIVDSLRFEP